MSYTLTFASIISVGVQQHIALCFFLPLGKQENVEWFSTVLPPRHNAMILVCDAYALFKLLPKFAPA